MADRGQTVHDYLLGILIVLLTVAAVFAFFPNLFAPFEEQVNTGERHMSERLASELVDETTIVDAERTVDWTELEGTLTDADRFDRMITRSGITDWTHVNVTVRGVDGDYFIAGESNIAGAVYRPGVSDPTATQIRTIQAHYRSGDCANSCQLVVRVWTGG